MLLQAQRRAVLSACASIKRAPRRCLVVKASAKEDVLLRSMSANAEVSVLVLDGTKLVAEAAMRHKTAPTATAALGRTLMGALLMGSFRKDEETVQINFKGDGPLDGILAVADSQGNVKGRVGNPQADPPLRADGKLNVGEAIGLGVLAVVRTIPWDKNPYTGMVPIVSGEVAEDLASYLVESEQTNSALGLGVSLDRDCNVKSAGGWLVQILPFCSEETLSQLETNLGTMPSVTTMLNSGLSPEDIAARIFEGLGTAPGSMSINPRYGPCDDNIVKQRMIRAVASLGRAEVEDIIRTEGKIEVTCDFCQQTYQFEDELILGVVAAKEDELMRIREETARGYQAS